MARSTGPQKKTHFSLKPLLPQNQENGTMCPDITSILPTSKCSKALNTAEKDGWIIWMTRKSMETGPLKKTSLSLNMLLKMERDGANLFLFWKKQELNTWSKTGSTLSLPKWKQTKEIKKKTWSKRSFVNLKNNLLTLKRENKRNNKKKECWESKHVLNLKLILKNNALRKNILNSSTMKLTGSRNLMKKLVFQATIPLSKEKKLKLKTT